MVWQNETGTRPFVRLPADRKIQTHAALQYMQHIDTVTIDVLLDEGCIDNFDFAFVRETHEYDVRLEFPDFVRRVCI